MLMVPIEVLVHYLFTVAPFTLYVTAYFWFIALVATPLGLHGLTLLLLLLASLSGMPERIASDRYYAVKIAGVDGWMPGYLSLGQVVLTVLRYTRVLNDYASYDCSTTGQVSWYDWTG